MKITREGDRRRWGKVNCQSALHLKVIRILHFFCVDLGRERRNAVG